MNVTEFSEAVRVACQNSDKVSLNELRELASQENNPYFYSSLAWWAYELPPEGGETFKSTADADKYFKLAYEGFLKLAKENKDPDAMSILSDMYEWGKGIAADEEKSKYWRDRCYLTKTGLTFDEWKRQQS